MRRHPTYADVVSTLCLVLLLGGTAYAATQVTGKDIKNSSVTGKDVKDKSLKGADLKDGSVTGADVAGLGPDDIAGLGPDDIAGGSTHRRPRRAGRAPGRPRGPRGRNHPQRDHQLRRPGLGGLRHGQHVHTRRRLHHRDEGRHLPGRRICVVGRRRRKHSPAPRQRRRRHEAGHRRPLCRRRVRPADHLGAGADGGPEGLPGRGQRDGGRLRPRRSSAAYRRCRSPSRCSAPDDERPSKIGRADPARAGPDWSHERGRQRPRPAARAAGRRPRRGQPHPRRHGGRRLLLAVPLQPPALPRRRRAAGRDEAPGAAGARGLAAAPGRLGHRHRVRGRLRVGRGVQPRLRPGLRPPAERAQGRRHRALAARAQRHPLPPAVLAVGGGRARPGQTPSTAASPTLLLQHDVDDTRLLLDAAKQLPDERYRERPAAAPPGARSSRSRSSRSPRCSSGWSSPRRSGSPRSGRGLPRPHRRTTSPALIERHDEAAPRWLAVVRDIERRGAWDDRLVDALCDPPESFVLGGVVAHVLTYSAAPAAAGPPAARAEAMRSTAATRSTGAASPATRQLDEEAPHDADDLLHRDDPRRLPRRRARLRWTGSSSRTRTRRGRSTTTSSSRTSARS